MIKNQYRSLNSKATIEIIATSITITAINSSSTPTPTTTKHNKYNIISEQSRIKIKDSFATDNENIKSSLNHKNINSVNDQP